MHLYGRLFALCCPLLVETLQRTNLLYKESIQVSKHPSKQKIRRKCLLITAEEEEEEEEQKEKKSSKNFRFKQNFPL
jgi:hypothetical protein